MIKFFQLDSNEENIEATANLYKEIWQIEDDSVKARFLKHSTYEDYKCIVAQNEKSEIVGFSYGYTSLPGQYYNGLLKREFSSKEQTKWLTDCFELVELAVHPSYRRQSIGRILMTELLKDVEYKTALLTTQINNNSARRLYESLNWQVLREPFFPHDNNDPFIIMGRELF
ncbi:GNAT family N-acetyltransferase [Amphibacillus sp. Q70]|uniref:GNAT family N-acetyltransferase n=1 Tax=Amphibacillus sp. Q70 TaxID=3453416 RepID=UPI003F83D42D